MRPNRPYYVVRPSPAPDFSFVGLRNGLLLGLLTWAVLLGGCYLAWTAVTQ
jgi:hypothetical protein